MQDQVSIVSSKLENVLGDRMTGLLHIGSNERNDETVFSDIDLILLVRGLRVSDLIASREIIRNLECLIDMPTVDLDQIPSNPDLFQVGNHGCHFIEVLKGAKVVYGTNFFLSYPEPSKMSFKISIFRKIVEYTFSVRRIYVESNRGLTIYQNYQISGRLLKVVKDLLLLSDVSSVDSLRSVESVSLLKSRMNNLLNIQEWEVLESISNPNLRNYLASNLSENFLQARVLVIEKLYSYAISLINI